MEYTRDDISIAGRKGGSAFIPDGKAGVFPLHPLHPRKLKDSPVPGSEHSNCALPQALLVTHPALNSR